MWNGRFDQFCEDKKCRYIHVEYRTGGYGMADARTVSCMLIGLSGHIMVYPDDCPYIEEIKKHEAMKYGGEIKQEGNHRRIHGRIGETAGSN